MQIVLPEYQPSYKSKITQLAYTNLRATAQNLLDRALLIYEKYCNAHDDALYDLFRATIGELDREVRLLRLVSGSHWFETKSLSLNEAAQSVAWEDSVRATMLFDLAGCLRGK